MPAYHGGQPSSLFGEGQAPAPPDLGFHLGKLDPYPFQVVFRLTQNRPLLDVAQMCVNPRE